LKSILLKILLPIGAAYVMGYAIAYFRKHDLGYNRLFTFQFVDDIRHTTSADGFFNWLNFSLFLLATVPAIVMFLNFVSVLVYYPIPQVARRIDKTIERLAKLPAHAVYVRQLSPTLLLVSNSPDAPLTQAWYRENEEKIEAGAGIDITAIIEVNRGLTKLQFERNLHRIPAAFWIETNDGSGTLKRVEKVDQPFVYVHGDDQTLEDCTIFKIGFSQDEINLARRFAESKRQMRNPKRYVCMRVIGKSDEDRIHDMFAAERIHGEHELFNPSPRLLRWIRENQS